MRRNGVSLYAPELDTIRRGYCFRDSKRAEKIWQSAKKDAAKMPFSIYRCLDISYLEKYLIVV